MMARACLSTTLLKLEEIEKSNSILTILFITPKRRARKGLVPKVGFRDPVRLPEMLSKCVRGVISEGFLRVPNELFSVIGLMTTKDTPIAFALLGTPVTLK